jgi:hypothetical protein
MTVQLQPEERPENDIGGGGGESDCAPGKVVVGFKGAPRSNESLDKWKCAGLIITVK